MKSKYILNDINIIYITLFYTQHTGLHSSSGGPAFQQETINFFPRFTHAQVQFDTFLATVLHCRTQHSS